ncbi:hypothetical protein V1478_003653 [Vespula squamosa]|uniref:Uncharacterized protein n=1 Tax=Vespula squamosa TaxID=30214 RepID=A0ABD2BMH5_VESSQ
MEDGRSERSRITGTSQHPYVHVPLFKKTSPRSHREEVAAFGNPRANGDSTLQFAFRDAFPLRELQASQPTGDGNDCLFSAEYTKDVRSNVPPRGGCCIWRPAGYDSTLHTRCDLPLTEYSGPNAN